MHRLLSAVFLSLSSLSCMSFARAMEQMAHEKAIFEYAKDNKWQQVKEMVCADKHLLSAKNFLDRSLLAIAVNKANKDAVTFIIKKHHKLLLCRDGTGRLPMHLAAGDGDQELCETLMLCPQYSEDFLCDRSKLIKSLETLFLIRKFCPGPKNSTTLAALPRLLVLAFICKPLEEELIAEPIASHKNVLHSMLSMRSNRGRTPSDTAQNRKHDRLVPLLELTNMAQWDQKIEDAYKIIKN